MEKKTELEYQYAQKIQFHLTEIFNEGCDYYINKNELLVSDKATAFFHALANIVPAVMYNNLTRHETNYLEFNHIANQLVFQFSKSVK